MLVVISYTQTAAASVGKRGSWSCTVLHTVTHGPEMIIPSRDDTSMSIMCAKLLCE